MNNLYALSMTAPVKTRDVIARFKKVMEYQVEETRKQFVMLGEEIALVDPNQAPWLLSG